MAIELLLNEAQGMSEEALMEVIRFMRFIKVDSMDNSSSDSDTVQGVRKYRTAGSYRGQIKMSEDFDEPIDDFIGPNI